jgi:hypothetical protein
MSEDPLALDSNTFTAGNSNPNVTEGSDLNNTGMHVGKSHPQTGKKAAGRQHVFSDFGQSDQTYETRTHPE